MADKKKQKALQAKNRAVMTRESKGDSKGGPPMSNVDGQKSPTTQNSGVEDKPLLTSLSKMAQRKGFPKSVPYVKLCKSCQAKAAKAAKGGGFDKSPTVKKGTKVVNT